MAGLIPDVQETRAHHTSLEQLDQIIVALPCQMNWSAMPGDDRKRYCAECQRNVYNFREMARSEIATLFDSQPERICGRLAKDSQGRLITKETAVAEPRGRLRRLQFSISFLFVLTCVIAPISAVSPALARWVRELWDPPLSDSNMFADGGVMVFPKDWKLDSDDVPLGKLRVPELEPIRNSTDRSN